MAVEYLVLQAVPGEGACGRVSAPKRLLHASGRRHAAPASRSLEPAWRRGEAYHFLPSSRMARTQDGMAGLRATGIFLT